MSETEYTPDTFRWVLQRRVIGRVVDRGLPSEAAVINGGERGHRVVLRYDPEHDRILFNDKVIDGITEVEFYEYLGVIAQIARQGWSEPV